MSRGLFIREKESERDQRVDEQEKEREREDEGVWLSVADMIRSH